MNIITTLIIAIAMCSVRANNPFLDDFPDKSRMLNSCFERAYSDECSFEKELEKITIIQNTSHFFLVKVYNETNFNFTLEASYYNDKDETKQQNLLSVNGTYLKINKITSNTFAVYVHYFNTTSTAYLIPGNRSTRVTFTQPEGFNNFHRFTVKLKGGCYYVCNATLLPEEKSSTDTPHPSPKPDDPNQLPAWLIAIAVISAVIFLAVLGGIIWRIKKQCCNGDETSTKESNVQQQENQTKEQPVVDVTGDTYNITRHESQNDLYGMEDTNKQTYDTYNLTRHESENDIYGIEDFNKQTYDTYNLTRHESENDIYGLENINTQTYDTYNLTRHESENDIYGMENKTRE